MKIKMNNMYLDIKIINICSDLLFLSKKYDY